MQTKVVLEQDLDSTFARDQRFYSTSFKTVFLHNSILPSSYA